METHLGHAPGKKKKKPFRGPDGGPVLRVIVNNLQKTQGRRGDARRSGILCKTMREIKGRKDVLEYLAGSVAPRIHGLSHVKQGILLQLAGGVEAPGCRPDIHMLQLGDPATGRSDLARAAMNLTENPILTNGRGSTGPGMTATVSVDTKTRERKLQAGAAVMADKSYLVIDEFDKADPKVSGSLLEVMEQQTVSIAKAGIQCTLNARCTVNACAAFRHTSYDPYLSLIDNIAMKYPHLSRFDLIFLITDNHDARMDEAMMDQIMQTLDDAINDHNPDNGTNVRAEEAEGLHGRLTHRFLAKYLARAKTYRPTLTKEVEQAVAMWYAKLRQGNPERGGRGPKACWRLPSTTRAVQGMCRLCCAHAKLRFSDTVTLKDFHSVLPVTERTINLSLPSPKARDNIPRFIR